MSDTTNTATSAEQLERARDSGASWFYWIAALSLVNTFAAFTGSDWRFIIGLGITQVVDIFAAGMGGSARWITLAISLAITAGVAALGYYGRKIPGLLLLGIALLAVDAVIFVLAKDWIGVGFHALVIFFVFGGWGAARKLREMPAQATAATAPTPEPSG